MLQLLFPLFSHKKSIRGLYKQLYCRYVFWTVQINEESKHFCYDKRFSANDFLNLSFSLWLYAMNYQYAFTLSDLLFLQDNLSPTNPSDFAMVYPLMFESNWVHPTCCWLVFFFSFLPFSLDTYAQTLTHNCMKKCECKLNKYPS